MTSTARTSISSFPRGHEFAASALTVSAERVAAYVAAVGDTNDYAGCVPGLAVVAFALDALQEVISLPDGSLHTGQEVEHIAAVRAGDALTLTGRIAQRSERQRYVISVIEMDVSVSGTPALRARTTIMAPAAAA